MCSHAHWADNSVKYYIYTNLLNWSALRLGVTKGYEIKGNMKPQSRKQWCSNFAIINDFQTLVSWPSQPNLTFHFFEATETQLTLRVSNLLGVAPALLLLVAGLLLLPSSPITGSGLFCTIFSMSCKAIWCSEGSEIPAFSIELPWFSDPRNNSNTAVCKKIDCSKHSTPGDIDML